MAKGIIIGIFCFMLFLSHIFVFYAFSIKRRFFAMVKLFFSFAFVYCVLYMLIPQIKIEAVLFAFLSGAVLHFIFCYLYLYFVQIIDRTPTTRIMIEIEKSSQKELTLGELNQAYSIDKKISCELEDMLALGHLRKEGSFYHLTPSGKLHMSFFKLVRNYLKLRRS